MSHFTISAQPEFVTPECAAACARAVRPEEAPAEACAPKPMGRTVHRSHVRAMRLALALALALANTASAFLTTAPHKPSLAHQQRLRAPAAAARMPFGKARPHLQHRAGSSLNAGFLDGLFGSGAKEDPAPVVGSRRCNLRVKTTFRLRARQRLGRATLRAPTSEH